MKRQWWRSSDKLVVDKEAFNEALECEIEETFTRSMFENIQDDELNFNRLCLEFKRIFDYF